MQISEYDILIIYQVDNNGKGFFMALVVASLWIGDSPRLAARNRHQVIQLDRAIADEVALTTHLEELLGARVRALEVHRLDLVNDTTLVDVRYRLLAHRAPLAQDAARDDDLPFVASPADNWVPLNRPTAARHAGAASR